MSVAIAPQRWSKKVSEIRTISVNLQGLLDSGELLTGTPIITEVTTSDLTLTNKVISTTALTINGVSVAIAEAVQFTAAVGVAGTEYEITISIGTNASPAQTLGASIILEVVADSGC